MRLNVQATQLTTPTAHSEARTDSPDREAYKRASALADHIVEQLTNLPRSTAVVGDLTGYTVRLNFGTNNPHGVQELAQLADVPASKTESGTGIWFEARATIKGIPVCAEVLLSVEAAAAFEAQTPPPDPAPTGESAPAVVPVEPGPAPDVTPVPLSESNLTQDQADPYDQSLTQYVASLGGSVVAHDSAIEADGPDTIAFVPVSPAAGGEQ